MYSCPEDLRYSIEILAYELASAKRKESKMLEKIAKDAGSTAFRNLENEIVNFASEAERNFLTGKKLSSITAGPKDFSTYDHEISGTTDIFPCTMSYEDGIWMFYLPPTPSVKNGKRANDIGRFTGYLVRNLIGRYEQENGKVGCLSEPIVVFEFGFRKKDPFAALYDADNRDNKRILDALTGHFYTDDNILTVRTLYYGVVSDDEYTKVYVMEKSILGVFLARNSQW